MSTVTTVTVVPADKLIICDGVALVFDFQAPDGLHALQWRDDAGHTEWTGGPNRPLTVEDYDEQVAPYVALWRKEKTRREEMAAEEAAARALPDAKEAKIAEALSGYDAALAASLTMPAAMPTSQDVAVGAALFAVDDADGLAFIQERHAARRDLRRRKIFRAGDVQPPAFKERSKLFKLWGFDFYRRFALRDARHSDKHVAETHIE